MKYTYKNVFALLLFASSLIFFLAATEYSNTMLNDNCFNCSSSSACLWGGQSFGWTDCYYSPENPPPSNCQVFGSSECGGTDPGESD